MRIYISTFGKEVIKVKDSIPLEVGATKDNFGDNISAQNAYFGELTDLYWIWKNATYAPDSIVGFCHYNKALDISNKKIEKVLFKRNNMWIVAEDSSIPPHPRPQQVRAVEEILESLDDPRYYRAWKNTYSSDASSEAMNPAQMFITTGKELDNYCNFLFKVLFELRNKIGNVEDVAYFKRYCAIIGERLLAVYLIANEITPVQAPIIGPNRLLSYAKRTVKKNKITPEYKTI